MARKLNDQEANDLIYFPLFYYVVSGLYSWSVPLEHNIVASPRGDGTDEITGTITLKNFREDGYEEVTVLTLSGSGKKQGPVNIVIEGVDISIMRSVNPLSYKYVAEFLNVTVYPKRKSGLIEYDDGLDPIYQGKELQYTIDSTGKLDFFY